MTPDTAARPTQATVAIVVYCPRCDYFRKTAVQVGKVGTHGCAECDGQMEVYVAHGYVEPSALHHAPTSPPSTVPILGSDLSRDKIREAHNG